MTEQLLDDVMTVLTTDADLAAFCQQRFGQGLTVQLDYDDAEDPARELFPVAIIESVSQASDIRQRRQEWDLDITVATYDHSISESSATIAAGGLNVITSRRVYDGRLAVEALREQVWAALCRGRLGKLTQDVRALGSTQAPRFYSTITLKIERI